MKYIYCQEYVNGEKVPPITIQDAATGDYIQASYVEIEGPCRVIYDPDREGVSGSVFIETEAPVSGTL